MTRRGHYLESCWTAVGMNPSVLINASVARAYPTAKAAMAKPRESKLPPADWKDLHRCGRNGNQRALRTSWKSSKVTA